MQHSDIKLLQRGSLFSAQVVRLGKFVVKVGWEKGSIPPKSHPLSKYFLYPVFVSDYMIVQPEAELRNRVKACNTIRKALGLTLWNTRTQPDEFDLVPRNCGWYERKAVCFDTSV